MNRIDAILERVRGTYQEKSLPKYPSWEGLTNRQRIWAVAGEIIEFVIAIIRGDIYGEHGAIAEAIDSIIVLARFIDYYEGRRGNENSA